MISRCTYNHPQTIWISIIQLTVAGDQDSPFLGNCKFYLLPISSPFGLFTALPVPCPPPSNQENLWLLWCHCRKSISNSLFSNPFRLRFLPLESQMAFFAVKLFSLSNECLTMCAWMVKRPQSYKRKGKKRLKDGNFCWYFKILCHHIHIDINTDWTRCFGVDAVFYYL